jgi:hypothetical protein
MAVTRQEVRRLTGPPRAIETWDALTGGAHEAIASVVTPIDSRLLGGRWRRWPALQLVGRFARRCSRQRYHWLRQRKNFQNGCSPPVRVARRGR